MMIHEGWLLGKSSKTEFIMEKYENVRCNHCQWRCFLWETSQNRGFSSKPCLTGWWKPRYTDDPWGIVPNPNSWLEHHSSSSFLSNQSILNKVTLIIGLFTIFLAFICLLCWFIIIGFTRENDVIISSYYVPSICLAFSLVKPKFPACSSCQVHQSHSWYLGPLRSCQA